MTQRFRVFSAFLLTGVFANAMGATTFSQAPATAAPAAQAPAPQRGRGPAGPPAPCGPSVTGKNIAAGSRCFELRTYTVRAEGPGDINLIHARFRDHTDRLLRKHVTSTIVPRMVAGAMRLVIGPCAERAAAGRRSANRVASFMCK